MREILRLHFCHDHQQVSRTNGREVGVYFPQAGFSHCQMYSIIIGVAKTDAYYSPNRERYPLGKMFAAVGGHYPPPQSLHNPHPPLLADQRILCQTLWDPAAHHVSAADLCRLSSSLSSSASIASEWL
jgi:hypothetical protein